MEFVFQVSSVNLGISNCVMISKPKISECVWLPVAPGWLEMEVPLILWQSCYDLTLNSVVIVVFLNKDKAFDPLYRVKYLLEMSLIMLI